MDSMQLVALGVNHYTAPVSVRGQLAFEPERLPQALRELLRMTPASEAAILSTCNRTELYCMTDSPQAASDWLARYHALDIKDVSPYLYTHPQLLAARHMFRVAAGLDSMVLGEPQILGQMKQAAKYAEEAGALGPMLNKLFQRTFAVAKEVRSTTAIGERIVSFAGAALHLTQQVFDEMAECKVLFVGAGEMVELCLGHFAGQRPRRIDVANRTLDRALILAARHGGSAIFLEDVPARLHHYDIIISCTASPRPVIGFDAVRAALAQRKGRPQVIVDLAVPRDTEPEIAALENVTLHTLDDIAQLVDSGLETRQAAVVEAEAIIDAGVSDFWHWVDSREVVPTIRAMRDNAEQARRHELDYALKLLARGVDPASVADLLSQALTNKLMHAPTYALRQAVSDERADIAQLIERIYQLKPAK